LSAEHKEVIKIKISESRVPRTHFMFFSDQCSKIQNKETLSYNFLSFKCYKNIYF